MKLGCPGVISFFLVQHRHCVFGNNSNFVDLKLKPFHVSQGEFTSVVQSSPVPSESWCSVIFANRDVSLTNSYKYDSDTKQCELGMTNFPLDVLGDDAAGGMKVWAEKGINCKQ